MKRIGLLLALVGVLTGAPAVAAPELSPQLSKLGVSTGKWVFHGKSLKSQYGRAGSWTWHEDCRWSSNRLFLECTFDNTWSGKTVRSLVVDTYNTEDKSYWHYEFFAEGAGGDDPFVPRMTVHGTRRRTANACGSASSTTSCRPEKSRSASKSRETAVTGPPSTAVRERSSDAVE